MFMKNIILKCTALLFVFCLSLNINAASVLIYSNDFSTIETLTSSSSSNPVTSSNGAYTITQGTTSPSGTAVMGMTAYFTNTSSTGNMVFNNLALNNGGSITVTWGSTKRDLSATCNSTLLTGSPVTHTGALQTSTFTIPATITGTSTIKLSTSGGSGVYIFGIQVFTNSLGPIIDGFTLAGSVAAVNTVNATTGTITVTVPFATNLNSILPTFTLEPGTSFVTPADATTPKNFTGPVSYVVTDGTDTRTYTVTVSKTPASTGCNILTFTIPSEIGTPQFIPAAGAVKDSIIVTVPFSTTPAQMASLVPTYTTSPLVSATSPNTGVAQNFTSIVPYTITAQDGTTTKTYWVRVQKAPASTACNIGKFSLGTPNEMVSIDDFNKTISVTVAGTSVITSITPTDSISPLSTIISPAFPTNFTNPVNITVKAESGATKTYTVTTTKDNTPPSFVSTSPADLSVDESLAGVITLTFSENVKLGTGAITLGAATLTPNAIPANGLTQVTIPFSGLTGSTTYTVTIPAGAFTDMFGNPSPTKTFSFTTGAGVNHKYPYASKMDGANFPVPAFITGGVYDPTADVKATTTTQYGAYKLAPGEKLTITSDSVGTILANVYAPGSNRTFTITNNLNTADIASGSFVNYSNIGNKGSELTQTINSITDTEIYITNTSTAGDIYIPYIYLSKTNQPIQTQTEKEMWCK